MKRYKPLFESRTVLKEGFLKDIFAALTDISSSLDSSQDTKISKARKDAVVQSSMKKLKDALSDVNDEIKDSKETIEEIRKEKSDLPNISDIEDEAKQDKIRNKKEALSKAIEKEEVMIKRLMKTKEKIRNMMQDIREKDIEG